MDGRWRKVSGSCKFDLQLKEQELALAVFREQRLLLDSLHLNVWSLDKPRGRQLGFHDLVAEFSTERNFGVKGLLSVELKVFAAAGFERQVAKAKKACEEKLAALGVGRSHFECLVLIACKVERLSGRWGARSLVVELRSGEE